MTAQVQAWLEPVPPDMRLFFWAVIVVARCVFGYLTLFLTRILVKSLGMTLLPLALPASDVPAKVRLVPCPGAVVRGFIVFWIFFFCACVLFTLRLRVAAVCV